MTIALAALAVIEIVFQVGVAAQIGAKVRQRRAPEIGVQNDARSVDHTTQRR